MHINNLSKRRAKRMSDNEQSSEWFWADGVPGEGARPEFLSPKYKSVSDQAKAQRELESRMGQVPHEYDLSKASDWMDTGYGGLQKIMEHAKERRVPQDVMDVFFEEIGSYVKGQQPNLEKELAKLGENGEKRLTLLKNWAEANLSEKAYKGLIGENGLLNSAEAIESLEEVRNLVLNSEPKIPTNSSDIPEDSYTLEDYRLELQNNLAQMQKDPTLYSKLQKKLNKVKGLE